MEREDLFVARGVQEAFLLSGALSVGAGGVGGKTASSLGSSSPALNALTRATPNRLDDIHRCPKARSVYDTTWRPRRPQHLIHSERTSPWCICGLASRLCALAPCVNSELRDG